MKIMLKVINFRIIFYWGNIFGKKNEGENERRRHYISLRPDFEGQSANDFYSLKRDNETIKNTHFKAILYLLWF